jgi:phosphopantetheine binding protein
MRASAHLTGRLGHPRAPVVLPASRNRHVGWIAFERQEQEIAVTRAVSGFAATVAKEMGDVLSRGPLDPMDDFFLCGGDSLNAVELISRLADRYASGDSRRSAALRAAMLVAVFDEPTPQGLASIIAEHVG